jgi:hypothetical protein
MTQLTVLNGKIMKGESLSTPFDCRAGRMVRITLPTQWIPGNLTFQFSSDGNGYNDMFNDKGEEVTLPDAPAGAGIVLSSAFVGTLAFIKIRTGTRDNPVVQDADRDFAVAIETESAPAR